MLKESQIATAKTKLIVQLNHRNRLALWPRYSLSALPLAEQADCKMSSVVPLVSHQQSYVFMCSYGSNLEQPLLRNLLA